MDFSLMDYKNATQNIRIAARATIAGHTVVSRYNLHYTSSLEVIQHTATWHHSREAMDTAPPPYKSTSIFLALVPRGIAMPRIISPTSTATGVLDLKQMWIAIMAATGAT